MSWEFENIGGPFTLTEGPAWDGDGLVFSDIEASRIMRFDVGSHECTSYREKTNRANGLMFDKHGRLYACEQDAGRIVRYEKNGAVTILADSYKGNRFNSPNDLAIDSSGTVWFTDPRYGDHSGMALSHMSVYRLETRAAGQWDVERVVFNTTRPNGVLLSMEEDVLYVSQAGFLHGEKRELRAYPIREDGSLGTDSVLHNFAPYRGVDGMCLDTDGNLIACAGEDSGGPGSMIYVFEADGRIVETHPVPFDKPTNCTFGGPELKTLFVTTIGGYLLRADTGRQGHLNFPVLS